MTCTSVIPDMDKSFNSSQPNPPAPTTNTFALESKDVDDAPGSNSPIGKAPSSFANGEGRLNKVAKDPLAGIVSFEFEFELCLFGANGGLFSSTSYVTSKVENTKPNENEISIS